MARNPQRSGGVVSKIKDKVTGIFKKKDKEPALPNQQSNPQAIVASTDAAGYKYEPSPRDIIAKTNEAGSVSSQSNNPNPTSTQGPSTSKKSSGRGSSSNNYNPSQAVEEAANSRYISLSGASSTSSNPKVNDVPQRNYAPEETIRRKEDVKQSAMNFVVDESHRYESDAPKSREEKINRGLSKARQDFQDQVNRAQNSVFVNGEEKKQKFTGEGVKTIGEVGVYAGASVAVGVGKAVKGTLEMAKNTVTLQPGNFIDSPINLVMELATNPKGLGEQIRNDFQKNPVSFTTEQAANIFIAKKTPGAVKATWQGAKRYVRRNNVAGMNADPLKNIETTGQDFFKGDLDIEKNVQTTLTGERANPDLLPPKKSPLGLDETPFYSYTEPNQKINLVLSSEGELKAKGSIFDSGNVFDDVVRIPEMRAESTTNIFLDEGGVQAKIPIRDEVIFGERLVGERTKTDFFPPAEVTPTMKVEIKPIIEIKNKGITEKQKELNFDDMNNFLGANIGLITEPVKLFGDIKAEFNIKSSRNFNEPFPSAPDSIMNSANIGEKLLAFSIESNDYSKFSSQPVSMGTINFSGTEQNNDVKPVVISEEQVIPVIEYKPKTMSTSSTKSSAGHKSRASAAVVPITSTATQSVQLFEPINKSRSESKKSFDFETPKPKRPEIPSVMFKKEKKQASGRLFDVYVRKQGKWRRVNTGGLSEREALNFGAFKVGNTSAASFKVKESQLLTSSTFKGKGAWSDFYKKGDVYIEKRGRRIKSSGEKREITFKGIQTKKARNIFGRK